MQPVARKILLLVAAMATIVPLTGCAGQLLPSEFDQTAPQVNGENVVWEDTRDADSKGFGTDIYMYNIGTLLETPVATGTAEQQQPAISDKYVAWIENGRLMAKSLSGGAAFNVVNGSATQTDPAVCGSVVTWSDTGNNSDVYARDLSGSLGGGAVIHVATTSAVEAYPACDNGRVVYMYSPVGGQADVRLYDMASGQTSIVANQLWNEWRPAISGNRVVWQAWPTQPDITEGIQIYGKNLGTGDNFVVSEGPDNQTAPVISGSTVAWEDNRQGRSEIWWRDLATTMPQTGIPVDTDVAGSQQAPSLFQRRIVFQNDSTGPWNVDIGNLFFYTGTP
jgi:beta propeller repeat protein